MNEDDIQKMKRDIEKLQREVDGLSSDIHRVEFSPWFKRLKDDIRKQALHASAPGWWALTLILMFILALWFAPGRI